MKTWSLFSFLVMASQLAWGHAHLISPAPRNPDPGIKVGPCGPFAKVANPITLTGGTTLTVQWQETINHPGKYIFTWLQQNDTPMPGVPVVMIPDNANGNGDLPHNYTTTLVVPNTACANCGLQMVQSMEENPAAPTYYYSCVDIRIAVAGSATPTPTATPGATPTPTPSGTSSDFVNRQGLGGTGEGKAVVGSSCGSVAMINHKSGGGGFGGTTGGLILMLLPLMTFLLLRRKMQMQVARVRK